MRQKLLRDGANELSYEIRGIVKKADLLKKEGRRIYWENIGDPIQKNGSMPEWMREIIGGLINENETFGYCHSKGVLETREYLAEKTNELNGVQIDANDILFFNGLGDAISKLYQFLVPTSRIIGPSPAYSTHSSAEAAHANTTPLTYKLDPENNWYPDMDDLYLKIKYNPNIVGILIINPDNPTGMVYPREILDRFVEIAKEFNLFLVSDEIYANVTYNGAKAITLAEYIGNVPGIALKGISKEFPWPGSRCGWMEYYNRSSDPQFNALCQTLDNAKMIEVCSTKLPQMAIPRIMKDPRYLPYRKEANDAIGKRAEIIASLLGDLPQLTFNKTYGAFYNTIIFKKGMLKAGQSLKIDDPKIAAMRDEWVQEEMPFDKQFVYNLLAAKGVCVVPISSFCSELEGFRVTLLEENEELLKETFTHIREAVIEYCS
ncbi:pyridoxal phosphate-dependent aminotransferase [Flammeovirga agarivorans]|uniref:alanine transaminase n=1 Tax=Flammeovirga agarivorans TaxID=2726742 RepID=A0A7X8SHL2_9BACT|nr:pyridoxal phosphate-dependent aminotransferase [Flammeovirga agarivorans]NLR90297.1 pyridoxal phosphate-dependent aminotransferase [Flammeovirga agarivorans]